MSEVIWVDCRSAKHRFREICDACRRGYVDLIVRNISCLELNRSSMQFVGIHGERDGRILCEKIYI